MNIEVQRTTKSLDQGHRTSLRGLSSESCLLNQMGLYGPIHDPQYPPHQLRTAGQQETQLKWKTQYPLAYGLFRYYLIDQQCGAFGHTPRTAAGAEASSLATECYQVFMMTFAALHPQEAMLQAAAFEVIGKFLFFVQRKGLVLSGHHIPELRVVSLDDLIEKRLFRPMALIRWAVWRPGLDRDLRNITLLSMESLMFS
jgi:hypothetical protein